MKKVITNGILVTPKQTLEGYDLVMKRGRIVKICPKRLWNEKGDRVRIYDAKGAYVLPGFVDIHSDMIESYIQPRSTALMDFELGLGEAEKTLVMCGITSMFHSISMYREGNWDVKEIRRAPAVRRLAELIRRKRGEGGLIRHFYHLRYEIDNLACYEEVKNMISEGLVDLLSFMDHRPGQGQYRNLEVYRKHQNDGGKKLTEEEFAALIQKEQEKRVTTFEERKELARLAQERGITVASHDDDTVEKLEENQKLGVRISEFPITLEVAKEAVKKGFFTVLGAPNVLLGGSHSGNLSAVKAIREGAAGILVSDYYPQSLLHAVFHLYLHCGVSLWDAVAMVTKAPAEAVGLGTELGSLEKGKRADLLIVRLEDALPKLQYVFVEGTCVLKCREWREKESFT